MQADKIGNGKLLCHNDSGAFIASEATGKKICVHKTDVSLAKGYIAAKDSRHDPCLVCQMWNPDRTTKRVLRKVVGKMICQPQGKASKEEVGQESFIPEKIFDLGHPDVIWKILMEIEDLDGFNRVVTSPDIEEKFFSLYLAHTKTPIEAAVMRRTLRYKINFLRFRLLAQRILYEWASSYNPVLQRQTMVCSVYSDDEYTQFMRHLDHEFLAAPNSFDPTAGSYFQSMLRFWDNRLFPWYEGKFDTRLRFNAINIYAMINGNRQLTAALFGRMLEKIVFFTIEHEIIDMEYNLVLSLSSPIPAWADAAKKLYKNFAYPGLTGSGLMAVASGVLQSGNLGFFERETRMFKQATGFQDFVSNYPYNYVICVQLYHESKEDYGGIFANLLSRLDTNAVAFVARLFKSQILTEIAKAAVKHPYINYAPVADMFINVVATAYFTDRKGAVPYQEYIDSLAYGNEIYEFVYNAVFTLYKNRELSSNVNDLYLRFDTAFERGTYVNVEFPLDIAVDNLMDEMAELVDDLDDMDMEDLSLETSGYEEDTSLPRAALKEVEKEFEALEPPPMEIAPPPEQPPDIMFDANSLFDFLDWLFSREMKE